MRLLTDHPDFAEPVNIGSAELISLNDLAKMVMDIADKRLRRSGGTEPESPGHSAMPVRLCFSVSPCLSLE